MNRYELSFARAGALAFAAVLGIAAVQLGALAHVEEGASPDLERVRPIPGLTAERLASFQRGRQLFEKTFGPKEGLGPLFNNTSCRACHGTPYAGGSTTEAATLAGGMSGSGEEISLKEFGGPMIQLNAVEGIPLERFPAEAKFISRRISPPTFGLGLIEAVPTTAVTAQLAANPARAALGIRGRANWEFDQLGRFGWKAQKGDLVEFSQQACQFELGLSSPGRPQEHFPNLPPQKVANPSHYDDPAHPWVKTFFDRRVASGLPMGKPDLSQQQIEDLAAFQRYQAPVAPAPASALARRGRQVFAKVHCDMCHVPSFKTGPNKFGVPAGLDVPAFSDLLVHDMGEAASDGLIMGVAKGSAWRTAPLWGLRYRERFMHDGRAQTLHQSIEDHAGEAAKVTALYDALADDEKRALIAFLKTL